MNFKEFYGKYKIFDSEVHLASPMMDYYRKGSPDLRTMWAHNTAEDVLSFLDETGIDKCLVETPCLVLAETDSFSDANHVKSNNHIYNESKKSGRLVPVGRVNPNYGEQAVEEFKRCINDYGIKALKIHPICEFFYPSHKMLPPIFEIAAKNKIPVMWHSGADNLSHVASWVGLADRFPDVNLIAYHGGGPGSITCVKPYDNIYLQTSGWYIGAIRNAISALGDDRVIYGSDAPFAPAQLEILKITMLEQYAGIKKESIEKVMGQNIAILTGERL